MAFRHHQLAASARACSHMAAVDCSSSCRNSTAASSALVDFWFESADGLDDFWRRAADMVGSEWNGNAEALALSGLQDDREFAAATPHPNPPPQGGRERKRRSLAPSSSPLMGEVGPKGPEGVKASTKKNLVRVARRLRKTMTPAERKVWRAIKELEFAHAHFRRQAPIGPYVVDFASHRLGIVIEVDGGQHNEAAGLAKDRVRDAWLHSRGYRVLRFWNNEVMQNIAGVTETIMKAVRDAEAATPHPNPPPQGGRGRKRRRSASSSPLMGDAGPKEPEGVTAFPQITEYRRAARHGSP